MGAARRITCAAVLACGMAGCSPGGAGSAPPAPPSRVTVPAVSTPAASGDPAVLARRAYLGMWRAYTTASRTADYQSQALDHYAAGEALALLQHGLYQNHQEGIVTRGEPSFHPVVKMTRTKAGTAEAKVTDCSDDSRAAAYYKKTGKPAPGERPGRQLISAQVQPFDGTWKVTYVVVNMVGSC